MKLKRVPEYKIINAGVKRTHYPSRLASMSLPSRTPKGDIWTRTNGRDTLTLGAGVLIINGKAKRMRIPSGIYARRLFCFLVDEFFKAPDDSRKINLGACLESFAGRLGISRGGREYELLYEQALRMFSCTITLDSNSEWDWHKVKNVRITEDFSFWEKKADYRQESLLPGYVTISEEFAPFLTSAIPVPMDHLKAIGANCGLFDLYVWVAIRRYSIARPLKLSWVQMLEQFGSEAKQKKAALRQLRRNIYRLIAMWEGCIAISEKGVMIPQGPSPIAWKKISAEKLTVLGIKRDSPAHRKHEAKPW